MQRRALADANYRGSSVLIPLEDSSIIVGVRKNTIESLEKALQKVVKSFSVAIPHLVFELQKDFKWFSQDPPTALPDTTIRTAVQKELDRLQSVAKAWQARPFFEAALRSFAGLHVTTSAVLPDESGEPAKFPFSRKRTQNPTTSAPVDVSQCPNAQRARTSGESIPESLSAPATSTAINVENDIEMTQ